MGFQLVDIVRDGARERGDRTAITAEERTLSYAELNQRANRAAAGLAACGVGPGHRVVWLGKNRTEFFDLLFGAAKLRAAVAPLNFRLTGTELLAIVQDAQATVVVLGPDFADLRGELTDREVLVVGDEYEGWLARQPADEPDHSGGDDDTVLQLYTSGTTGLPKGVLLTNQNFSALLEVGDDWSLDAESVALVAMPLFHIGGCGFGLVGLAHGARCVLVADIDPPKLLDTIETERVSNAFLVPAVLQFLTRVPGCEQRDYSALRSIAYGASPITSAVLRRALEVFRAPLFQVYGLTETTGAITELPPGDHDPGGPREYLMRSAGRAYPWVQLATVDPISGRVQPAGEVGEIWIRSGQVTPGYWNRPDETEQALTSDGWLRTGDAGYLDEEGYLFLTDRIKDMIVTGAENVYPIEVEEVLAGHPDVADIAVIGVPHETWGEAVHAMVVAREGAQLTEDALVDWARERVAGFKRPRSVAFVDELPRGATGKILKKELRAPYWPDAPG